MSRRTLALAVAGLEVGSEDAAKCGDLDLRIAAFVSVQSQVPIVGFPMVDRSIAVVFNYLKFFRLNNHSFETLMQSLAQYLQRVTRDPCVGIDTT